MASRYQKLYLYFLRTRHHSMINRFSTSLNGKWMGETDQSRKIENLKSKSFKIEQLSETENTSNTATEDTQGPNNIGRYISPPFTGTAWFIIWPLIKFSGRSVAEYLDNANANESCPSPPWQRLPAHSFPITARVSFFIGPESDHWQCLSLTDSLTDSLTHWLTPV